MTRQEASSSELSEIYLDYQPDYLEELFNKVFEIVETKERFIFDPTLKTFIPLDESIKIKKHRIGTKNIGVK